jgi:hypothetical protein
MTKSEDKDFLALIKSSPALFEVTGGDAEILLQSQPRVGNYLIRPSSQGGAYTLSWVHQWRMSFSANYFKKNIRVVNLTTLVYRRWTKKRTNRIASLPH